MYDTNTATNITTNAARLITGNEIDTTLNTDLPVLLLVWNGETLKSDFKNELDKASQDHAGRLVVIKCDVSKTPTIAERFEVGKHPVLIGWVKGETIVRRNRPWATDVGGVVEELLKHAPAAPAVLEQPKKAVVESKPIKVTEQTFQKEVVESPVPVLVDFWAEWCGPCKMVAPALEKLAAEFAGKVRIAKVNVDENPRLSQAFQIMSIPNLMFFKSGKIVGQQAGALPEHVLRDAIKQLIALKI